MGNNKSKANRSTITLSSVTSLPILSVYLDYAQYPLGGILVVTGSCVENYDNIYSSRVSKATFDVDILTSDFNPIHRILAIGFKDGSTKILSCDTLLANYEFVYETNIRVTAVNAFIPLKLLVGYQDGIVKEYDIQTNIATRTFTQEKETPVSHIQVINKGELTIVAYNDTDTSIINGYRANETSPAYTTMHENGRIIKMNVISTKGILITLSSLENTYGMFNCSTGEVLMVVKFHAPEAGNDFVVTDFGIVGATEKLFKLYTGKDNPEGDLIVMITDNGDILTGMITINSTENPCTIKLHKIYKGQSSRFINVGGVVTFCIDPVTDKILVANVTGTINIIDRAILWVLNPTEAQSKEERKEESSWIKKIGFLGFDLNTGVVPLIRIHKAKKPTQSQHNITNPSNATTMNINNEETFSKTTKEFKLEIRK